MGWPVVTVASGGMPVTDVTATKPLLGRPVTEAANKFGQAVTKVTVGGLPVTYVSPPLIRSGTVKAGVGPSPGNVHAREEDPDHRRPRWLSNL